MPSQPSESANLDVNSFVTGETPIPPIQKSTLRRLPAIAAVAAVSISTISASAWAQTLAITNETAKLLPSDGTKFDAFGFAVAIRVDTAVVGMPNDGDNGGGSGSAYVFVRDTTGVLTQQAKLLASDGVSGDNFGLSAALTCNTVIIGAPSSSGEAGSAYIFVRDASGVWTQQAKLLPSDGATGDNFGISVTISGDTAVVGAAGDDDNGSSSGSAYVFVRSAAGAWTQQVKILPHDGGTFASFGRSVALRGNTTLIGANRDNNNGINSGSTYIFTRGPLGFWRQQAKLLADDGSAGDGFGRSIAFSGDTAIVGASSGNNIHGVDSGSAYVFTRDASGRWTQEAKLLADDGAALDAFGGNVAISGDTAVVGAVGDDDNGTNSGSAYAFSRDASGVWTQQAKLLASDGAVIDLFSNSVSISGGTVVVGAYNDDDNGLASGSAYIFILSPADLNGDGTIDGADLSSLLSLWGARGGPADLNNDSAVDSADLAILLASWS